MSVNCRLELYTVPAESKPISIEREADETTGGTAIAAICPLASARTLTAHLICARCMCALSTQASRACHPHAWFPHMLSARMLVYS